VGTSPYLLVATSTDINDAGWLLSGASSKHAFIHGKTTIRQWLSWWALLQ